MDGDRSEKNIALDDLLDRVLTVCLSTKGRLRRHNRFLFACDLVMSVTPEPLRERAQRRLVDIANRCGLLAWESAPSGEPAERR